MAVVLPKNKKNEIEPSPQEKCQKCSTKLIQKRPLQDFHSTLMLIILIYTKS